MMKSLKKGLGGFNSSFFRVGEGHSVFNFLKRGLLKQSFGNPGLD